jgi:MYXO-CTERM domain-containing protein
MVARSKGNADMHLPSATVKKFVFAACLAALSLGAVSQANASTLLYTGSSLTGIDGVLVDNNSYNVNFVLDTYDNLFATSPPLFLNQGSLASDAANSLLTIFSSNNVQNIAGVNGAGGVSVIVPYQAPDIFGNFLGVQDVYNITASNAWALFGGSPSIGDNQTYGHNVMAVFAVSEPATWVMMLAGLLGLAGFAAYRRRNQAGADLAA